MSEKMFQVAIDGPAASGKSTVARLLAQRIGGYYINTGDMYRAVAYFALSNGINPDTDADGVAVLLSKCNVEYRISDGKPLLYLNGEIAPQEHLRAPEVAAVVSQTARIGEVRSWMLERQRSCKALGIVIMEGRDIGTVIFPDAKFKFFVTATPMERARRRFAQPGEVPPGATLESVAAAIAERDRIDSTRPIAPLKPAPDAITILTDGISADEVTTKLADYIAQH